MKDGCEVAVMMKCSVIICEHDSLTRMPIPKILVKKMNDEWPEEQSWRRRSNSQSPQFAAALQYWNYGPGRSASRGVEVADG